MLLTYMTMALCLVIFVRLFTYRRDGARYRPLISAAAVVVMACCGALVIHILAGDLRIQGKLWPMVGLLSVFAIGLVRCGGNLSMVLRGPIPSHWDGSERRHTGR